MLSSQRHLYDLPPDVHYLNCAYMSPLTKRVQQAGIDGIRRKAYPAGIHASDFFSGPDALRAAFAALVHAEDVSRIAIVPAVSYGIDTVVRNTALDASQNIVVLGRQFPSNVYPWRQACAESGAALRTVEAPDTAVGRAGGWNERLLAAIDSATAVVSIAPLHWTDGTRFDLEAVGARAREVGAAFVLDATQSLGAVPLDVRRIQPDALVCSAYKWLGGPYSIGAAYYGPRYDNGQPLEHSWHPRMGSEDFNRLVDYRDEMRAGAVRYNVGGVANFILVPMLTAALQQLLEWGVDNIVPYCRRIRGDFLDACVDAGFRVTEPEWRSDHLFGLWVPDGYDMAALQARLDARNISVALRGGAVRISPYVYNDEGDFAALREAVLS